MPLSIRWEDERGKVLEELLPDRGASLNAVVAKAPDNSVCLRFIDPYGDTVFNRIQLPLLISELQRARQDLPGGASPTHLDSVLALVRKAEDEVHTYVRFLGD